MDALYDGGGARNETLDYLQVYKEKGDSRRFASFNDLGLAVQDSHQRSLEQLRAVRVPSEDDKHSLVSVFTDAKCQLFGATPPAEIAAQMSNEQALSQLLLEGLGYDRVNRKLGQVRLKLLHTCRF
jgi:hypothetical protein